MRRATNHPDIRPLSHIGLDAVLDRRQLEALALHTDVITVSRGTSLADAGRLARQFVAVIDGLVDVTDGSGRTHVAGPGTHIGAAEIVNRQVHEATFVTRSDCHLVVIARRALAATFSHPRAADWARQHSHVEPRPIEIDAATPAANQPFALVD